jgi:hypothetical protein
MEIERKKSYVKKKHKISLCVRTKKNGLKKFEVRNKKKGSYWYFKIIMRIIILI